MDVTCTRTVISTNNYDECYAYYRDVLEWPIFIEYKNSAYRGTCFGTKVWGIEIIEDLNAPPENERARGAMEVDDVRAFRDMVAAKVPNTPEVETEAWSYSFILKAPDGYRIKFFTRRVPGGTMPTEQ